MTAPGSVSAWLFCLVATTTAVPDEDPGRPPTLVVVGQLSRIDLVEQSVWIRIDGRAAELQLRVETKQTDLTWGGRLVRFEDLKPGERAMAVYAPEVPGPPRARVLKLGPSRYSVP